MQPICTFEEALAEIETLNDTIMDIGVEEKIKNLVAALRMFGVKTIQSCEGHNRPPYVEAELESMGVATKLLIHFNRHDRADRGKHLYWVILPMPHGFTFEPKNPLRPLTALQAEAEEFARTLVRLADTLRAQPQPPQQ